MSITVTEAQLARLRKNLGDATEAAPQPATKLAVAPPARVRIPAPKEEGEPVWGILGAQAHFWQRVRYGDGGHEYTTLCGRYQRHSEPDGSRGGPCVECLAKEEKE